ncbi:MAG: MarR family transcriptional regulator [Bacteroidetes bacterium]|nr:MarR family transcriptional regulator [Bacteroidota bacterium]NCQ12211.1 MarR family transcriptional regulator [Bacteroidota bacterium]
MDEFLSFIVAKRNSGLTGNEQKNFSIREIAGSKHKEINKTGNQQESELVVLLTLMFKYAKQYIKKGLQKSELQTADDFSYLIVLLTYTSLTKMELIQKNVMEKTSGMEVIKRLQRYGMLEQFDDEIDKRSKRVKITEKGKIEIFRLLPEMSKISSIVSGNLSDSEKLTLSYLLKKLDQFHNEIYLNEKGLSIDELFIHSSKK